MTKSVEFARNRATVSEIAEHLLRCDAIFVPPLSSRTEIDAYARKVGQRAGRFEAWAGGSLVGLVAAYCNDPNRRLAYLTNVSVEPAFQRAGIGSALIADCIKAIVRSGFAGIELEVDNTNEGAIALYARHGFSIRDSRGRTVVMYMECGTG